MFFQYTIVGIAIVMFLYFPGLILKKFYFIGPYSKQSGWGNLQDKFVTGFLAGIFIHSFIITIYCAYNRISFGDYNSLKDFYDTVLNQIDYSRNNKTIYIPFDELKKIFYYWIFTLAASAICGYLFFRLVITLKLDIKYKMFRFANHWHYYFRGRILNEKKFKEQKNQVWVGTQVDVLVQTANGNILYTGLLSDYELSHKECKLETIYLQKWMRYNENSNSYKDLPGEFLVIPFEKSYNINLRYIYESKPQNKQSRVAFKRRFRSIFYFALIVASVIIPISQYNNVGFIKVFSAIIFGIIDSIFVIGLLGLLTRSDLRKRYEGQIFGLFIVYLLVIIIISVSIVKLLKIFPL